MPTSWLACSLYPETYHIKAHTYTRIKKIQFIHISFQNNVLEIELQQRIARRKHILSNGMGINTPNTKQIRTSMTKYVANK
jgi:hypothetical protein